MSGLSRETRDLLERGRSGGTMPSARRASLKRKVLATVAAGSLVTTSATTAAWALAGKVLGVAALAVVVTGGVVVATRTAPAPTSTVATTSTGTKTALRAPANSAVTTSEAPTNAPDEPPAEAPPAGTTAPPEASLAVSAPAPAPVAVPASPIHTTPAPAATSPLRTSAAPDPIAAPRSPAPASQGTQTESPGSTLEVESQLIRSAQQALVDGDPATALRLADDHAARFPKGALEPERSALRVFALCALAQPESARAAAAAFLAAHPSGPLAKRVRTSCGGAR